MRPPQPPLRKGGSSVCGPLILSAVALLLVFACALGTSQDFQARLPAFQAPASDSLQSEMMSRISLSGQLQPGDLARLSRLAVLNSISMLVNVRADLPHSPAGYLLDQELTSLWNSSEAFYEVVSTSSLDTESMAQAQYWLESVFAAQRRVESSLGEFPALSPRAANDLQSLSRLLGPIGSAIGSLESALADANGPPTERRLNLDVLRRDAQIVANDLVSLIGKAADAGRGRPARDAVVTELTDLLERVQSLSRLLSTQPSQKAVLDSFRAARRQMWRAHGRITHMEWRAALDRPWREVRNKLNELSNELGLPRVIEITPASRPLTGPERAMAAHVDHAVAWLDEFLAANGARLGKTADGPRFVTDAVSLRNKLLNLRRRAIAGEPAERLAELLSAIESSNQQLSERAVVLAAYDAAGSIASRYRNTAEAVRKIRGVAAKG
jgi:hypothetical protein